MAIPRDQFTVGFLLGILVGEGYFGGDGKQPHVAVKMHVRHEKLFQWLQRAVPGARLYGPYHHGGRHYYQWMVRGKTLHDELWPLVMEYYSRFDDYVKSRIVTMGKRYKLPLRG